MMGNVDKPIEFTDKILDNVHGFIPYTAVEGKIIDSVLFKRLQSIKQLSLVNWIFPGSEHTRFIHSLGVMHIADKIAIQLKCTDAERQIIRLAGLLHDIGHYPLSHLCEVVYKEDYFLPEDRAISDFTNTLVQNSIDTFQLKTEVEFMNERKGVHHEAIGVLIIRNCTEIRNIITDECGEDAVDIICDMISGKVDRDYGDTNIDLMVQILHSELDADGIDYMLRDAMFAGTSFGSFEVDFLISSLEAVTYNNRKIVCIRPKGIAAADQYLINKFFSYSQVVFNKHTIALEWMAKQIGFWMRNNNTYFPRKDTFQKEWIENIDTIPLYLEFTDNFFWNSINAILNNPAAETFPKYIIKLCKLLLLHKEIEFIPGSEVRIISKSSDEIVEHLKQSVFYQNNTEKPKSITIMNTRAISSHIPESNFLEKVKVPQEQTDDEQLENDTEFDDYKNEKLALRLMEGICIHDELATKQVHLLCDDHRSLMQQLSGTTLVVMRTYKFDVDE